MDIIYVDTSVLISILFEGDIEENISLLARMNQADEIVSCGLLEAEFMSVLVREKIPLEDGKQLIEQISLVFPDQSLMGELKKVLSAGYLRGADAFHLACALYLDSGAKDLEILTRDKPQAVVAEKLGFKVFNCSAV